MKYDCALQGHIWIEADGTVFSRHQGREQGKAAVTCKYCRIAASIEQHAAHTAPPQPEAKSRLGRNPDTLARTR